MSDDILDDMSEDSEDSEDMSEDETDEIAKKILLLEELYINYNNKRYGIPKKNNFKKEINSLISELEGKCDKSFYEKYIIQTISEPPKREFIQIGKHKGNLNNLNIAKRK